MGNNFKNSIIEYSADYSEYSESSRMFDRGFRLFIFFIFQKIRAVDSDFTVLNYLRIHAVHSKYYLNNITASSV